MQRLLLGLGLATTLFAADWLDWRGPKRDGTSAAGPVHLAGLTIPVRQDDTDIPVASAIGAE